MIVEAIALMVTLAILANLAMIVAERRHRARAAKARAEQAEYEDPRGWYV